MHEDNEITVEENAIREFKSTQVEFEAWWRQTQGKRMKKSKYLAWKAWLFAYRHYRRLP